MPKKRGGGWHVDVRPWGAKGPRKRKSFDNKAAAIRYESHWLAQGNNEAWEPQKKDTRKFSELIEIWCNSHGNYLKDIDKRKRALLAISGAMGDPVGARMTAQDFTKYRSSKPGVNDKAISPKTLNNHLGYCNAVFNELERMDVISYPSPFLKVKAIKIAERELSYLTNEQIAELMITIQQFSKNKHIMLLTKICLSTGCRWGEAESLTSSRVKNQSVTFTDTKSGKNRTVPIHASLEAKILAHGKGKLFTSSMKAFDRVLKQVSFETPAGQSTHILRHTFASHFIMNGGDILSLQRILGHSTINMTMRYAHLSKEHLSKAVALNPLYYGQDVGINH